MYMGMRTHVYTGIWTPDIAIRCLSQLLSTFKKLILNKLCMPGIVVHAFNAMHLGLMAEAGGCLSLRPTWPTQQVPGQPVVHRETLSQEQHNKQKNKMCYIYCLYMCMGLPANACVEVRQRRSFLLLPYGSQESNSGRHGGKCLYP